MTNPQTAAPAPAPATCSDAGSCAAAPVQPNPLPSPGPVAQATPNYPAPNVPLAQPPQYTIDQIMAAGATLMDAGKVNELRNLLMSFGSKRRHGPEA